jgi:hypothetical protein
VKGMALYTVQDEQVEIGPKDVVRVKATDDGYDNIELRSAGTVFDMSGKYFQNGIPSWVEILDVFEAEVKVVEELVAGKKKERKSVK